MGGLSLSSKKFHLMTSSILNILPCAISFS